MFSGECARVRWRDGGRRGLLAEGSGWERERGGEERGGGWWFVGGYLCVHCGVSTCAWLVRACLVCVVCGRVDGVWRVQGGPCAERACEWCIVWRVCMCVVVVVVC